MANYGEHRLRSKYPGKIRQQLPPVAPELGPSLSVPGTDRPITGCSLTSGRVPRAAIDTSGRKKQGNRMLKVAYLYVVVRFERPSSGAADLRLRLGNGISELKQPGLEGAQHEQGRPDLRKRLEFNIRSDADPETGGCKGKKESL